MRVVVTGAAGLTGGAVARRLLQLGHVVVGIIRSPDARGRVPDGVEPRIADCRDTHAMEPATADADALVHVAGILLGADVARLRRLAALGSVVVVSTAGLYSRHRTSAAAYRANEAALLAARPDARIIRPTMIYGSARDRNVHHVIRFAARWGVLPLFGDGARRIQPIHFEDLAAATCALLVTWAGGAVDAGGADAVTLRTAGETIFSALGRPPRFVPVPVGPALAAASLVDALRGSRLVERLERMAEDRGVDNTALLRLGVTPRDFASGVREEVAEMGYVR